MAHFHYLSTVLLLLVIPYSIIAQRHEGGRPGAPAASSAPAPASTGGANTAAPPASNAASVPASVPATGGGSGSAATGTSKASAAQPSSTGSSGGGSCTGSGMEIQWTGEAVSYSWSGGSGTTTGCLSLGSSWEGQVAVGGSGGTIFEGNPSGYFDVSYILGYSVPMVCSSGAAKSGCSKDLLGNGGKAGTVHKNPTGPGGSKDPGAYNGCASCTPWCYACSAPDAFFAPCSGSAYVYPYDDGATVLSSGTITCCIGTSCGTTGREGSTKGGHPEPDRNPPCELCSGGSKRSVDELEGVFKRFEAEAPAYSPSLLPRRYKGHKRHAVAHDAKIL